jgi:hypothetical protein
VFKSKNDTLAIRMWQRITPPTCGVWYCPDANGQFMWLVNSSPHYRRIEVVRYQSLLALFASLGYPVSEYEHYEAVAQAVHPALLSLEIRFKSDHTLGKLFQSTVRDLYDERSYLNVDDE